MSLKKNIIWIFVLVVLAMAFGVRFYQLSECGLYDGDASHYTSVAKQWAFDHKFINPYAKPAYHLLGFFAVNLIGYYDFTILYLNNFLDLINILLIFLIGMRLGMRPILGAGAAILYAFLPYVLKEAARGLAHLPSASFFLLAFYFFLFYFNSTKRKIVYLFLCSFFTIFAGNIHPTLLCTAIFYFLVLLGLPMAGKSVSIRNLERLKALLVYVFGGICVYVVLALILSLYQGDFFESFLGIFNRLFSHRNAGYQGHQSNILGQIMYAIGLVPDLLTKPVAYVFGLILFLCTGIWVRKGFPFSLRKTREQFLKFCSDKKALNFSLLWGVVTSFLLINFLTAKAWQPRFMIPIIPLIILGFVGLLDYLDLRYSKLRLTAIFFVLSVIYSFYNVGANADLIQKTPTVYREMGEVLYHKVDSRNRLLVSPSFMFHGCLETLYFDGDNVYRVRGPWIPDFAYLQTYNIRYVAVGKDLGRDQPKDPKEKRKLAAEYLLMYQGLKAMGADIVYNSKKVVILEVPTKSLLNVPHQTPPIYPFWNLDRFFEVVSMQESSEE